MVPHDCLNLAQALPAGHPAAGQASHLRAFAILRLSASGIADHQSTINRYCCARYLVQVFHSQASISVSRKIKGAQQVAAGLALGGEAGAEGVAGQEARRGVQPPRRGAERLAARRLLAGRLQPREGGFGDAGRRDQAARRGAFDRVAQFRRRRTSGRGGKRRAPNTASTGRPVAAGMERLSAKAWICPPSAARPIGPAPVKGPCSGSAAARRPRLTRRTWSAAPARGRTERASSAGSPD